MASRKMYRKKVKRLFDKLSHDEKVEAGSSILKSVHAADIADIIGNLSEERQLKIFQGLDDKQKSDVFVELPEEVQTEFIQEIGPENLLGFFKELQPDEAADLLSLLPKEKKEDLLLRLPARQQRKLRHLLRYGEESAGGIMTPILISVFQHKTVAEVLDMIRNNRYEEMILYVYVIDEQWHLLGAVPLQDLAVADPHVSVEEIMLKNPIAVNVHDDQELVAQVVYKYNLYAVPVVDDDGKLLGRITIDDAVAVAHEEADEDAYLMAGMDVEELHVASGFTVAWMRLPWLLTCLCGSFIAAMVLGIYEKTIAQYFALITFLPAICAMGGNSGLQASTVTIRNLAYGAVFYRNIKQLIRREILSGFLIGIGCSVVVATISSLWTGQPVYGVVIGISMLFTVFFSTCSGFFIPLFFSKINIDPAISSGPLITTINDAMSALIYLSVATFLFQLLG